ncbi:MAG: GWxTD domain-containing protein, partial [Acidobacteria bacterium]|nr:GWxTD domain-containing protein [Acidobacteriota bacterium]
MLSQRFVFILSTLLIVLNPGTSSAAKKKAADDSQPRETISKPMTERQRRRQEDKLRKELETPYRKWLNEDVGYIITDEERATLKRLATDEEREQFIEQFWLRRDPSPDTAENEFKEEHYRRIAYANERYASGIPGWKSDRGRIYITFGPPDEIESHPSGGSYERPYEEGGGTTSTYPFEKWRYRWIEGVGSDINIEFVDPTMTGEYRMTMDPSEKDALLMVPGAGLTLMEQMGMSTKTDRFSRTDGTRLGTGTMPLPNRMNQFERLEQFAKLQKA